MVCLQMTRKVSMNDLNESKRVVSHTLSLELGQIARLQNLARRVGRNRSDLAREALNELFEKYGQPEVRTDVDEVQAGLLREEGAHAPAEVTP
jgi:hypothetical protein